jgi:protein-S-isoprenylcysteine O-methyltransferase Ste14
MLPGPLNGHPFSDHCVKRMDQEELQQQDQIDSTENRIGARVWIQTILVIAVFPAAILFGSAGTFKWPMAWLYIGLSVATFVVSRAIVWRRHPDLLRERGRMMEHEDTASFDRVLAPLLGLVSSALIGLIAGFSLRFDWMPVFASWVELLGVAILLLGYSLGSWALVENRFFSSVVRIQKERGHHVITSGPYAIVRHPGYLGACLSNLGMVMMLGSPWALIPYVFQQAVLVTRTALEDRLLQAELPGYKEYTQRTRFRLFLGIW